MFKDMIKVEAGFQTSVNIAFDLYNDEKVKSFIPTISALDIIEDVMLSTSDAATQRARILIGAYGRGKSHVILVLMSLLFKKNREIFEALNEKMRIYNPKLYEYINAYITSNKKILPIIVSGSSASLTQSFLSALQQSLSNECLNDLMPETHFRAAINMIETWKVNYPETYKRFVDEINEPISEFIIALEEFDVVAYEKFSILYPSLTSGSMFNPFLGFDVVELYEKVVDKLVEHGYSGVFIVYDEFSKYLESSISNATISDIKLLQDFAEKCDRSGNKQMHLLLISHKDIANYINHNLPKEKVDGWRGVSGRFKHISLHNNFSQMYEIISAVIKKDPAYWSTFILKNEVQFQDLVLRFTANGLLDTNDTASVETAIYGCYPLHPISTFILPRLSEKVAQNERTLFTFLSTDDNHTLSAFLKNINSGFPLLTPDYIYDYFEPLFRKEPYMSEIHKLYKLTSTVLQKVEPGSLGAKIIKTIALIYAIEQFEKLSPVFDVVISSFINSVNDPTIISETLDELIEKECIIYLKRSNNYLKIKESSGIDIPGTISAAVEKIKNTVYIKDILNEATYDNYMYPTRYNDEYELIRYFEFTFLDSTDFWVEKDWTSKLRNNSADGTVYAILPKNDEDLSAIREHILSSQIANERIVFVLPKKYHDIRQVALEFRAIQQLKSLVIDDALLADEYDIYLEDLEDVIGSFIASYTRPENRGAKYFYLNNQVDLYRKAQLSALLSQICEETFPLTPIINNESINKNALPTVAINSRTKLLTGLLKTSLEPNLGLTGTGQDVSIMRSTLIRTGILEDAENSPRLNLDPSDDKIRNVIHVIQHFFVATHLDGERSFAKLYSRLTSPEYGIGLKLGLIPIFIAVVLHEHRQNLVIKHADVEVKVNADLLNSINEDPQSYFLYLEGWDQAKIDFMTGLEEIFEKYINEKEKSYNNFTYIVLAMNRWYMSLPKYAKEMTQTYVGFESKEQFISIAKSKVRFMNSLKLPDKNPRDYLFEKLFTIFDLKGFSTRILNNIRETKAEYDDAINSLVYRLSRDVHNIFDNGSTKKGSLSSVIKDWYEALDTGTKQYLFSESENKILELMKSITNDETVFIQRLCKAVTSLRIDDWNSRTIASFLTDLSEFKRKIDQFNLHINQTSGTIPNAYKIAFIDNNGREMTKTFGRTEYSKRAKLLYNDITASINDYGQAISQQEKRQVLIEILEKLC